MISGTGGMLGKYRIIERLGEGGMGEVYRARDEMLDRDVAIKVLRPELARQGALVERFRSEAVALARLAHPRIATLHGLEREGDELYMVMEYLRGETLEALVHRTGRLPWRRAAAVCASICDALDHAHDQGVVHRDIKPANVMLGPGGGIKVMDFGIARVIGSNRQTRHGHAVGTPTYMAPEQLRGEEIDGRTDLYALGAVLYELITGRLPFDADSDYKLMMMQLNETPPAPSALVTDAPSAIDAVVSRAMCKRREDRYASAATMRSALERAVSEAGPERAPAEITLVPEPGGALGRASTPPATRLASDARTPATRLAADARTPATRLAADVGGATPATRFADDPSDVGLTGVARDEGSSVPEWLLDWRTWVTAAAAVVAIALFMRVVRSDSSIEGPVASLGAESVAVRQEPGPSQVVVRPSPALAPATPPAAPPVFNRGGSVAPIGGASDKPPVRGGRGTGGRTEKPTPVTPSPVPPPSPGPAPSPAPPPAPDAGAAMRQARSAVMAWIAAIGEHDVGRVGAASSDGDLLTLVRERRVQVASRDEPSISLDGSRGTATAGVTLAVRSPFGSTKRIPVRFAFVLRGDGSAWTVSQARLVGAASLR